MLLVSRLNDGVLAKGAVDKLDTLEGLGAFGIVDAIDGDGVFVNVDAVELTA